MPLYKETPIQALINLINEANPGLPMALNETDFIYGTPTAITEVNGRNTKVKITPKSSSPYRGALEVTYRRIDLTKLFRAVSVSVTKWMADDTTVTKTQYIPALNQKYGLNLDINKVSLSGSWATNTASGAARTLTMDASDYFYIGNVSVVWNRGLPLLGTDIMTITELAGAEWPAGNDFVAYDDRSKYGNFLLSELDLTEYAMANGWASTGSGTISGAAWTAIFDWINARTGLNLNVNAYNADTNQQGLSGYSWGSVTLPNVNHPAAIKPGFTYARFLSVSGHPLFKSNIYLYFNL